MATREESLKALAMMMLNHHREDAIPGKIIIGVWRDNSHLNTWLNLASSKGDSSRIIVCDSKDLIRLEVENKDKVVILGIGLSQKKNYSDLKIIYYLTVMPKA